MSFVEIHDKAMVIVDQAREAERAGDKNRRIELLRRIPLGTAGRS